MDEILGLGLGLVLGLGLGLLLLAWFCLPMRIVSREAIILTLVNTGYHVLTFSSGNHLFIVTNNHNSLSLRR